MKIPGIAIWSILFAIWEAYALKCNKPTITELSAKRGFEILIWGWFVWLAVHLAKQRTSEHSGRRSDLSGG